MRKSIFKWTGAVIITGFIVMIGLSACAAERVAVIKSINGYVEWQKGGEGSWKQAAANMELSVSDKIRTKEGARCELTLDDGSLMKLRENSIMEINDLSKDDATGKKTSV